MAALGPGEPIAGSWVPGRRGLTRGAPGPASFLPPLLGGTETFRKRLLRDRGSCVARLAAKLDREANPGGVIIAGLGPG